MSAIKILWKLWVTMMMMNQAYSRLSTTHGHIADEVVSDVLYIVTVRYEFSDLSYTPWHSYSQP